MKNLIFIFALIFITACTEDSDQIENQRKIYAHYHVDIEKDQMQRIEGRAVFYEKSRDWFDDYVALRGISYVEYEDIRMQEVRDFFGKTTYENIHRTDINIQVNQKLKFLYQNNDGNVFVNYINLPSFPKLVNNSVFVNYHADRAVLRFAWKWRRANKFKRKSKLFLKIKTNTGVRQENFRRSTYTKVVLKDPNTVIESVQICSQLNQKAKGPNKLGKKIATYCDDILLL